MDLSLTAIETAAKEIEIKADADEIDLMGTDGGEVRFGQEVTARLTTRRVAEEFFINGQVTTKATLQCARCLTLFEVELSAPVEIIVHRVDAPTTGESALEAYVEIAAGTASFDISLHAREALLLMVPDVPHCREDCKGLCSQCGANLNVKTCDCEVSSADPRWDGLKQASTLKR